MKVVLQGLKIGDVLVGRVEERLADNELILNFAGDLVRAQDETGQGLKVSDTVTVVVKAIQPLRFQVRDGRKFGHLDLSV